MRIKTKRAQCCLDDFKKELLTKGVKADISLELETLDAPYGVEYFLWIPTRDHTAPSQRSLRLGVRFLHTLKLLKVPAYVHCKRGHGRAPTLVAAFLIDKGMSLSEAVAFIKKRRPGIHLGKKHLSALKRFERSNSIRTR